MTTNSKRGSVSAVEVEEDHQTQASLEHRESQQDMQAKSSNEPHHSPAERQLHHSIRVPGKDGWRRCARSLAVRRIRHVSDSAHRVTK